MYHLVDSFQNERGDGLGGYRVKLKNAAGAYAALFSDASSTPIITVSGIANTAITDNVANIGQFDCYVNDGVYDIEFFDSADALVRRVVAVPMFAYDYLGTPLVIGAFTALGTFIIAAGADLIQTTGYATRGDGGAARYVYDPAVNAAYVAAHPGAAGLSGNGRGYRLAEQLLDPKMFGPAGGTGWANAASWATFAGLDMPFLAPVTRPARVGVHALPASFVDTIGSSIPAHHGKNDWRFLKSRFAALDDFTGLAGTVHYYLDYVAGSDANTGLSAGAAVKHWYVAADKIKLAAGTTFVLHILNQVHGADSLITNNGYADFNGKKVKVVADHASGRCYFIGCNLTYTFTWTASGAAGAYKSTTADGQKLWRSALDANFLDLEGLPTPLELVATHALAQTTPGSFFRDGTGTTIHLQDGRVPSFTNGFIMAGETWNFPIKMDSGTVLFEKIAFCGNTNSTTVGIVELQYTATADFSTVSKAGFKNCQWFGSNGPGLMEYDFVATVLEDCKGGYCARDIWAYQTYGNLATVVRDARTQTAYEDNCVAYKAGYQGWMGATAGTSDNCSTAHQAHNMLRVGCRYYDCSGAVVADVNGCDSANYGVMAGDPNAGGAGPTFRPWLYWFACDAGQGLNPRMTLVGCGGATATSETALVQDGSHTTASIYVDAWQGDKAAPLAGRIKTLAGGALYP